MRLGGDVSKPVGCVVGLAGMSAEPLGVCRLLGGALRGCLGLLSGGAGVLRCSGDFVSVLGAVGPLGLVNGRRLGCD